MEWVYFLVPFVLLGIGVIFIAFSGGPGAARKTYLAGGRRGFRLLVVLAYVGLGIAVPAIIIASREEAEGGIGPLEQTTASAKLEEGKQLFKQTCASCHNLDAVNARGVTGPDLDDIGQISKTRALNAIENGGTGQKRMPAGLLEGEEADAVATYLARVSGR